MKKMELLSKILLSVWIVYNIFVMVVMPNVGAYFGRVTQVFVTPYANTVGLNAGWNFFSPEPAQPMTLKYTVHFPDKVQQAIQGQIDFNNAKQSDLDANDLNDGGAESLAVPDLVDDGDDKVQVFEYPPDSEVEGIPTIIRKREWALMRYMILDSKRLRVLMGPWFCKKHPGAESIEMEHIIQFIPFLDQAVKFKTEDVDSMAPKMKLIRENYNCSGGDEETLW